MQNANALRNEEKYIRIAEEWVKIFLQAKKDYQLRFETSSSLLQLNNCPPLLTISDFNNKIKSSILVGGNGTLNFIDYLI